MPFVSVFHKEVNKSLMLVENHQNEGLLYVVLLKEISLRWQTPPSLKDFIAIVNVGEEHQDEKLQKVAMLEIRLEMENGISLA